MGKELFIYKKAKESIRTYTVADHYGRGAGYYKGRYGIELEMECNNNLPPAPAKWVNHQDGSLRAPRGGTSTEYVLEQPLDLIPASTAVQELFERLNAHGSLLKKDSYRTSTHVHINVNDWRLGRVASFACLWFIFEDLMATFSGPMRRGNLFALRAIDAKSIIDTFAEMVKQNNYGVFRENTSKYAALNGYTMNKFGSLEIRTMRGLTEAREVIQWLNIIDCFYRFSERFQDDPREIFTQISVLGPVDFLKSIIGSVLYSVMLQDPNVGWSDEDLTTSAYEGIRTCQEIAYATDWTQVKEAQADPFGRKKKVITGHRDIIQEAIARWAPPPEPGVIAQAEPGIIIDRIQERINAEEFRIRQGQLRPLRDGVERDFEIFLDEDEERNILGREGN